MLTCSVCSSVSFAGSSAVNLIDEVLKNHPNMTSFMKTCVLALNMEYLDDPGTKLKNGDQIAIIPPISGG